jgi:uncharacterized protein YqeY
MTLKERIASDLKEAMKAKEQLRVDTLRSALSAFSYKKIEAGRELEESDQVEVVRKLVKQRTDSIAEFEKGKRPELAAKEAQERDILAALLPALKGPDDIRPRVRAAIEALPPGERTQGAAMKAVMPQLKGEADGGTIRAVVLEELQALGA